MSCLANANLYYLGIQYDSPMNPEKVAKIRMERIRNEKKVGSSEQ